MNTVLKQHNKTDLSLCKWLAKYVACPKNMSVMSRCSLPRTESVFGIGRDYQLINEATNMN